VAIVDLFSSLVADEHSNGLDRAAPVYVCICTEDFVPSIFVKAEMPIAVQ
jgi:hypothetical protein